VQSSLPLSPDEDPYTQFIRKITEDSDNQIDLLHHLAKQLWVHKKYAPIDVQNKCLDAWDKIGRDLVCKFTPLIPVHEDRPVTNLIFGSGGFSTGAHQAAQFAFVNNYSDHPPVILQGLVTNKSELRGCNAQKVGKKYNLPVIELDFIDWYHNQINSKEENPISKTRYWYLPSEPARPNQTEIERRFKIRQEQYHLALNEQIIKNISHPTDIASARGYNFQFCRNIFHNQIHAPHINDTHPADLTYINPKTKKILYPGWQAGAVELMIKDAHTKFRGSLIEVQYMDRVIQIDLLDEGVLLAIGQGIIPDPPGSMSATQIQEAMKIMDDYLFCTLEPTGLILAWGISDKALPVIYQDLHGNRVVSKQRLIVVGDKIRSGINAWGKDLKSDVKELENFLLQP
jgi:hypothetical protein